MTSGGFAETSIDAVVDTVDTTRRAPSNIPTVSLECCFETKAKRTTTMSHLQEFRNQSRKSIEKNLGCPIKDDDDVDLEHLFRTTKALIVTNKEILERCESSRKVVNGVENSKQLIYRRNVTRRASALLIHTGSRWYEPHVGKVATHIVFSFQRIDEEKVLEPQLDDLGKFFIPVRRNDVPDLIDYDAYLEKASLLDDATLALCLTTLKAHLEDMQVMLGEVESWLAHPEVVTTFLKSRFQFPPSIYICSRGYMQTRRDLPEGREFKSLPIPQNNSTFNLIVQSSSAATVATFSLETEDGFDTVDQFLNLLCKVGTGREASSEKRKRKR